MSEHLKMPHTCGCARKVSDDLKWGKHLGGTPDDHVGVQKVSVEHHSRYDHERVDGIEIGKVVEGRKPAILKK